LAVRSFEALHDFAGCACTFLSSAVGASLAVAYVGAGRPGRHSALAEPTQLVLHHTGLETPVGLPACMQVLKMLPPAAYTPVRAIQQDQ
jgi:hypothetical protein